MNGTQLFAKFMIKLLGWKVMDGEVPEPKCIILGVPHTSIKDFIISWFFYTSVGGTANIMIKKEFFFWPLGRILKGMGAVPVDRSHGAITAKQIIETMQKADKMHLAIAPEGTRKKTAKWKTGFHTIARACNIPIYLGYFNWKTKQIGRGIRFIPTENTQEDLKKIRAHYKAMNMEGCHPGHFDCGDVEPKLIEEQ